MRGQSLSLLLTSSSRHRWRIGRARRLGALDPFHARLFIDVDADAFQLHNAPIVHAVDMAALGGGSVKLGAAREPALRNR